MSPLWIQIIAQLLPVIVQAVETVAADSGKPPEVAIEDVIKHLTPGQPNAPALSS
jgi:hypothetical protein